MRCKDNVYKIHVTISCKKRIKSFVSNVFMYSGLAKYRFLFYKTFRKIWLYTVLLGMVVVMASSCGGSKKSASMRDIEKQSKKYPVDENGLPTATSKSGSKKVRQALAQQEKQKAAEKKEADKNYKDAVTRHRAFQTQETRDRMDQHLKQSNKKYSKEKEFFVARWFQPKDDIEKIEKRRAKEDQKRMAATRKKAEKTNKESGFQRVTKTRENKKQLPSPNDMPQGGGGAYKEGKAKKYASPSGIQHGGGGSYKEGKSGGRKASETQQGGGGTYKAGKSGKGQRASDYQQGGGGTYQTGRTGNGIKTSDYQQGGGGTYQTGRSGNRQKASDYQQGGGGNMSGKAKKPKSKK